MPLREPVYAERVPGTPEVLRSETSSQPAELLIRRLSPRRGRQRALGEPVQVVGVAARSGAAALRLRVSRQARQVAARHISVAHVTRVHCSGRSTSKKASASAAGLEQTPAAATLAAAAAAAVGIQMGWCGLQARGTRPIDGPVAPAAPRLGRARAISVAEVDAAAVSCPVPGAQRRAVQVAAVQHLLQLGGSSWRDRIGR